MEASLNNWTSLFLLASAQGFFLSFLLVSKKSKRNLANQLLSTSVFLFSLILLYCVGYWTKYITQMTNFVNLTLGLTYVIGPLMLWFTQTIQGQSKNKSQKIFHFIPFIAHISLQAISISSQGTFGGKSFIFLLTVAQNIHLILYAILILISANQSKVGWLKHIGWAYAGYAFCFLSYYLMYWTGILQIEYDYIVSFGMAVFIYFVGYYGYHQKIDSIEKYKHSGVTDSASTVLFKQLLKHIAQKKPYLNSNLKLSELADQVSMSSHIVSQLINQNTEGSFSELINKFRVEKAIKLMEQSDYQNEKLISIAYDCGFSNKVTFNSAFKKATGQTPSEYRKMHFDQSTMSIAS